MKYDLLFSQNYGFCCPLNKGTCRMTFDVSVTAYVLDSRGFNVWWKLLTSKKNMHLILKHTHRNKIQH
jgi:hypothetical protein